MAISNIKEVINETNINPFVYFLATSSELSATFDTEPTKKQKLNSVEFIPIIWLSVNPNARFFNTDPILELSPDQENIHKDNQFTALKYGFDFNNYQYVDYDPTIPDSTRTIKDLTTIEPIKHSCPDEILTAHISASEIDSAKTKIAYERARFHEKFTVNADSVAPQFNNRSLTFTPQKIYEQANQAARRVKGDVDGTWTFNMAANGASAKEQKVICSGTFQLKLKP